MVGPKRVVIVGGTHGNEWTGIKIVTHYQDFFRKKFPQLKLEFILANPEAYRLNCRFKDEDLNRAFQFLDEKRSSYEHQRAHEIRELIQKEPCLVIDLHTTTSNMGNTVIVSQYNKTNLTICKSLSQQFKDCRIIGSPDPHKKYLTGQSEFGLMIEVGPIANGLVAAGPLESTLSLIQIILQQVDEADFTASGSIELYEEIENVHYPKDEKGEIIGYIHPTFQGRDFQSVKGEFTPFRSYSGDEIGMKSLQEIYPIFINEAAYYPQHLAFILCQKKTLTF